MGGLLVQHNPVMSNGKSGARYKPNHGPWSGQTGDQTRTQVNQTTSKEEVFCGTTYSYRGPISLPNRKWHARNVSGVGYPLERHQASQHDAACVYMSWPNRPRFEKPLCCSNICEKARQEWEERETVFRFWLENRGPNILTGVFPNFMKC